MVKNQSFTKLKNVLIGQLHNMFMFIHNMLKPKNIAAV